MKIDVFDNRKCLLGEGPTSRNDDNSLVMWVDILRHKVLWRDINTSEIGSFDTPAEVGFALPRKGGGTVLGIADQIKLKEPSGQEKLLLTCETSQKTPTGITVRWNDAKVAPNGDLFAGSMAYDGTANAGSLYKISANQESTEEILSPVSISNGLDWNMAGDRFYYIDTLTYGVDVFDYSHESISNRENFIRFDADLGLPDGMCIDSEDGLWIAFWGGQKIDRYSPTGELTHTIRMPVKNVTSCCFAGSNLDMLIITTAETGNEDSTLSGMTFYSHPGVRGQKTRAFT